jgi:hypothetical protein
MVGVGLAAISAAALDAGALAVGVQARRGSRVYRRTRLKRRSYTKTLTFTLVMTTPWTRSPGPPVITHSNRRAGSSGQHHALAQGPAPLPPSPRSAGATRAATPPQRAQAAARAWWTALRLRLREPFVEKDPSVDTARRLRDETLRWSQARCPRRCVRLTHSVRRTVGCAARARQRQSSPEPNPEAAQPGHQVSAPPRARLDA